MRNPLKSRWTIAAAALCGITLLNGCGTNSVHLTPTLDIAIPIGPVSGGFGAAPKPVEVIYKPAPPRPEPQP